MRDELLRQGYCYLGTKVGRAELRAISVSVPKEAAVSDERRRPGERSDPKDPRSGGPRPDPVAGGVELRNLKVGALIPPRGDRPRLLARCFEQLDAQTRPPDEIFLVDDPPRSRRKDIVWRYRLGMERACSRGVDAVVICEDDDWYHPEYVQWLVQGWLAHDRPLLFGVTETWYYHVGLGKRLYLNHLGRASGFCTLMSGEPHPIPWPADHEPYVDLHLWRRIPGKAVPFGDKIRAVGIKHGIGMTGGTAHRSDFSWERIDGRYWFEQVVYARSPAFYSELV
jgi:glycosyltransferase involved in cell wall biosynthesis